MPDCPFCDETFLNQEELWTHIMREHPEKTTSAEAMGMAMRNAMVAQQVYTIAEGLTHCSIGSKGASREEVLERFRWFLQQLFPLFFGKGEDDRIDP